ncbi:helix-turn-helix transcriptional regulator [Paenibacillus doosanensis]|uniref:Response regulator protein VraR n=1 Tax=Paenibacillus konkukensis TaxID=2020716 RepID=A0ABY4RLK9_9BACL|nr:MULTISPECIES: helix-turn-helix transcriptional regulator [Paenibacillus]MCS7462200.1 helix-turn-helix transcriptional regulator [Paenibacillus doosanensis]UQZ82937.1 Response regulator protein VraR [Paenibacillus konkukensis]
MLERASLKYEVNYLEYVRKTMNIFAERNRLTRREAEIAALLLLYGYSNQELADHCTISVKTVKNHLDNMMKKLGIHSTRKLYSMLLQTLCCDSGMPADPKRFYERLSG